MCILYTKRNQSIKFFSLSEAITTNIQITVPPSKIDSFGHKMYFVTCNSNIIPVRKQLSLYNTACKYWAELQTSMVWEQTQIPFLKIA